jgi:quinol monooxygenase YgiN
MAARIIRVMATRLHLIAHVRAKAEHVDAVREILTGYVAPTRAEPGCLMYDLLQNQADPTHFTFVEEWADEASLEAHSRSEHLKAGRAKLIDLTQVPNAVLRYGKIA